MVKRCNPVRVKRQSGIPGQSPAPPSLELSYIGQHFTTSPVCGFLQPISVAEFKPGFLGLDGEAVAPRE